MKHTIRINSNHPNWDVAYERILKDDVSFHKFKFICDRKQKISDLHFIIKLNYIDIYTIWSPKINLVRAMTENWFNNMYKHNSLTGAPVMALIDRTDMNTCTIATSENHQTVSIKAYEIEEKADLEVHCIVETDNLERDYYEIEFRIDERKIHYNEVLQNVSQWWEQDFKPLSVPQAAYEPVYSTWYSFHQNVNAQEIIEQCQLAQKYNCKTLIIDDGWQTDDTSRGYAYAGDWKVSKNKIYDMKEFVNEIHNLEMKIMMWYTVPFIGTKSNRFKEFEDKLINYISPTWAVLDPRYPEVRNYIIEEYEFMIKTYHVDGLKLDFIDEFIVTPPKDNRIKEGMDHESVEAATMKMMDEMVDRLTEINPNILIEFRQTFNGPVMRKYGNMFRAVDCAMYADENRVRIADLRNLAHYSAVHSDMFMWHLDETVESAALQILNVMFSVPQISMRLETLPQSHQNMLKYYLSIFKKYQNVLLHGSFYAHAPAMRYPVLESYLDDVCVTSIHANVVIKPQKDIKEYVIMNGSGSDTIYLNLRNVESLTHYAIFDCEGNIIKENKFEPADNLELKVPLSGIVIFS